VPATGEHNNGSNGGGGGIFVGVRAAGSSKRGRVGRRNCASDLPQEEEGS